MNQIRITKEFRFEAAHALKGYDGPCKNVHGHSYQLSVTLIGTPSEDKEDPKLGMIMDFGDLKCIIRTEIVDPFDHALLLSEEWQKEEIVPAVDPFLKVIYLPYQPTSENMLIDFSRRINGILPTNIKLHNLRLRETATSYAEWFASDNPEDAQ